MKYQKIDIESSYRENDLGRTLYDLVLKLKPKLILEIGSLYGYSTVAMAMALDEIGEGKIVSYDLFDKYEFKHSSQENTQKNIDRYGVGKYVELRSGDFTEWIKKPEKFDFLHFDISNTGESLEILYQGVRDQIMEGSIVVFEGGSPARDEVEWMRKYNKKKMNESKVPYKVINEDFPSMSMIVIK